MAKITIYSTPTCPYCKMAKDYLSDKNIKYTDVDVAADEVKAHEMIHKSGQMGVPVIAVEKNGKEDIIVGFDRQSLVRLLGIS